MNVADRLKASDTAKLMEDAGIYMSTVAKLVVDDLVEREDEDGKPFLGSFATDGLMRGLGIISDALAERSDWLRVVVQREQMQEEENKAALARRSVKTTLDSTNVRNAS